MIVARSRMANVRHSLARVALLLAGVALSNSGTTLAADDAATTAAEPVPFAKPARDPYYRFLDERFGYQLIPRPRRALQMPDFDAMHLTIHSCQEAPEGGPWTYNWAVRRDPCTVVTGDLPRFALMRTYREPTVAPAFHKMGDLRLRLLAGGQSLWLDDCDPTDTRFFAWGTVHRFDLRPRIARIVKVTTYLAANRALAVQIAIETPDGAAAPPCTLEAWYGGMDLKGPNFIPPYLLPDAKEAANDRWTLEGNHALLSDPVMPDRVRCSWSAGGEAQLHTQAGDELDQRLAIRYTLSGAPTQRIQFQACQLDPALGPELDAATNDKLLAEAQAHYKTLLAPFAIDTPDAALNAAFDAAIVNLDYLYQPPAWLEGIHEWNSYYCNNYQISAAIDLGWLAQARAALHFFGTMPGGPASVTFADGSPADPGFEAGLPYFILQLNRYWQATADRPLLEAVWGPTTTNLDKMLKKRDPDGNLLLNWQQGCNAFLYQADHLGQPGDAPSPSYMVIGNLEQMAELAGARGDAAQAGQWRRRAATARALAQARLWHPREGRMASVDTQGLIQAANYYTDFAFPILYGGASPETAWLLLRTLDDTLWEGDHLMRSGNLKPPLFGNDMMGPVQMSEAAEAYFAGGRAERGWALLHGVALASTIYTNSPGSLPEYMTNAGFGQADWIFGNPAAAYVHATAAGLFGFERRSTDTATLWRPVLPARWKRAALKLDDVTMEVTGGQGDRRYAIRFTQPRALECRLPLFGQRVVAVENADGQPLAHRTVATPGGGYVALECPAAAAHTIRLRSEPIAPPQPPAIAAGQTELTWDLPAAGMQADDPQGLFQSLRIEGRRLTAKLSGVAGPQVFFLSDPAQGQQWPIELATGREWVNPLSQHPGPLTLAGPRQALNLDPYYNRAGFFGRNVWRFGENHIDVSGLVSANAGRSLLKVGTTQFDVRPNGKNLLGLEFGLLNGGTFELSNTDVPAHVEFKVGQALRGLELLTACELLTRLTGMTIGQIRFRYSDGGESAVPLIYGQNIDCYTESFASGVTPLKLGAVANLAAFAVPADPTRTVEQIRIEVSVPDAFVGILGANLVLAH